MIVTASVWRSGIFARSSASVQMIAKIVFPDVDAKLSATRSSVHVTWQCENAIRTYAR